MNNFKLKIIAIVTMLIDHFGYIFLYNDLKYRDLYTLCRAIGRISFPIFAFIIIQGFIHTKSYKKYLTRLLLFAIITEPFYDISFSGAYINFKYQNVLFLFVISLIMLYFTNKFIIISPIFLVVACYISSIIKADYYIIGPILIYAMYIFIRMYKGDDKLFKIAVFTGLILISLYIIPILISYKKVYLQIPFYILSGIIIGTYNEKIGMYKLKYFFYIFYPLHAYLLYLINKSLL